MDFERRFNAAFWMLRIGLGLGVCLAGVDKFFNSPGSSEIYLSSLVGGNSVVATHLHVSVDLFVRIVGGMEILIGLKVLFGHTRRTAYLLMLWMLALAVNLGMMRAFYEQGIHYVELAAAAFALALLGDMRDEALLWQDVRAAEMAAQQEEAA